LQKWCRDCQIKGKREEGKTSLLDPQISQMSADFKPIKSIDPQTGARSLQIRKVRL
jgi:hypothetical protein